MSDNVVYNYLLKVQALRRYWAQQSTFCLLSAAQGMHFV